MKWIRLGILWFFIWYVIASFFAPSSYSLLYHNVSDLATDIHDYSYMMTIGFIGYAFIYLLSVIQFKKENADPMLILFISLSALFMFFIGIFDTPYGMSDVPVYERTFNLHMVFAASQEILFIIIVFYHMKKSQSSVYAYHAAALVLTLALSIGFLIIPYTGLMQRFLLILNGLWTIFFFKVFDLK